MWVLKNSKDILTTLNTWLLSQYMYNSIKTCDFALFMLLFSIFSSDPDSKHYTSLLLRYTYMWSLVEIPNICKKYIQWSSKYTEEDVFKMTEFFIVIISVQCGRIYPKDLEMKNSTYTTYTVKSVSYLYQH